jgi:hypothetical protein
MTDLTACSICLRVRSDSEWLAAERVIRDSRTYDDELPRLHGAICEDCAEAIARRRATAQTAMAG